MSRSEGSFPRYAKLSVDANIWPDDYWDESYECPVCNLTWPKMFYFNPSPCCGKPCVDSDSSPHLRWPDAVRYLFNSRFEKLYDEYNEGVSDTELDWQELKTGTNLDTSKVERVIDEFVEDASKDRT